LKKWLKYNRRHVYLRSYISFILISTIGASLKIKTSGSLIEDMPKKHWFLSRHPFFEKKEF
jgi:hypothetical protein